MKGVTCKGAVPSLRTLELSITNCGYISVYVSYSSYTTSGKV